MELVAHGKAFLARGRSRGAWIESAISALTDGSAFLGLPRRHERKGVAQH